MERVNNGDFGGTVNNGPYETLTLYDESSIMNYCNPNYGGNQYTPSCADIGTIRALYGLHPTEKKDMGCILQCASGLDDNLAKTGASLAGCKLPTAETIIGSLAGLTPQVEYPGEGGQTPPSVPLPPTTGTPSGVKAIINVNITKRTNDNMTVNITTANGSEFYGHQVWIRRINGWLNKETANTATSCCWGAEGRDMTLFGISQTVAWTPSTFTLPQGVQNYAPLRSPSNLHFGWNYDHTKIAFSNFSNLAIYFDYYTCPAENCLTHGAQRIRVIDIPQSIEFFNSMDAKTVVPRPSVAYIPPKFSNGALAIAPFFMDRTEVTQREYMYIMRQFPFNFPGDMNMPAEGMTMYDAILYCNKRSVLEGLSPVYTYSNATYDTDGDCTLLANLAGDKTKSGYRLPTLAEWSYAYSANTTPAYFWGNNLQDGLNYAWSQENSGNVLRDAGLKSQNPWGLFDMLGSLQEWTLDRNYDAYGNYVPDRQCVILGDYRQTLSSQVSSGLYETCGSAGSKWSFIGFRPIRNAVNLAPILGLLLQ
jgi:hypothetical protein